MLGTGLVLSLANCGGDAERAGGNETVFAQRAPAVLELYVRDGEVELVWSPVPGGERYELARTADPGPVTTAAWSTLVTTVATGYRDRPPSSGTYRYRVRALSVRGAGPWSHPQTAEVALPAPPPAPEPPDTTPPETRIQSGPATLVRFATATFSVGCDETGCTYECSLDGAPFTACPQDWTWRGLADGEHVLLVRAIDVAGNVDPTPAEHRWRVDGRAPVLTFAAGQGNPTGLTTATFTWTSDEAASFRCRLDGGGWTGCTSGDVWVGLAPGDHTFELRGEDGAGNVATLVYTWRQVVPWRHVEAGFVHACGLRTDGRLFCWGDNAQGQLGLGHNDPVTQPTEVLVGTTWRDLSVGGYTSCAIRDTGQLYCWGSNAYGELGIGAPGNQNLPALVGAYTDWTRVYVGQRSTVCALRSNGTLWCWGYNYYGQVGNGAPGVNVWSPTQVGTGSDWVAVAIGGLTVCGLRSAGVVACWGYNGTGQVGVGSAAVGFATPQTVAAVGAGVQALAVGDEHVCAVDAEGRTWCWGDNRHGALGIATASFAVTEPVPTGWGVVGTAVAAGRWSTCLLDGGGRRYCWGSNRLGELGDDRRDDRLAAGTPADERLWRDLAGGYQTLCGVDVEGVGYCWGLGNRGQLGDGRPFVGVAPERVDTSTWTDVTLGNVDGCGLRPDGSPWCWGSAEYGTYGDGLGAAAGEPLRVATPQGAWRRLAGSGMARHRCGIDAQGRLWCWGANASGQLGDGTTVDRRAPVEVANGGSWRMVAVGGDHTCGIRDDGTLWCWGSGVEGQVGVGGTGLYLVPVQVGWETDWRSVSAGARHTCALKDDGSLWCWGSGGYWQIGDGVRMNRTSPVRVGTASDWIAIAAGGRHTCGLRAPGSLWCWGDNGYGQAGLGSAAIAGTTPTRHGTASDWVALGAGPDGGCATRADGDLVCWGYNGYGALGIGTETGIYKDPVTVATGLGLRGLQLAATGGCGLDAAGVLWCWGSNTNGQLGRGYVARSPVGVVVP